MSKSKKINKDVEEYNKFTSDKLPKPQKVTKKQYDKDFASYLCRLNNQSGIFLSYIGEQVKVVYQAPSSKLKLIGKKGKITNIISDALGNRIYEIAFGEKDSSSGHKIPKLSLTFSEDEIEFVNPEKFEKLQHKLREVIC